MKTKVLKIQEFPKIEKLQKKYKIFRAVDLRVKKDLDIVEMINSERLFRGFGKTTKKAFKNATKEVEKHYTSRTKLSA